MSQEFVSKYFFRNMERLTRVSASFLVPKLLLGNLPGCKAPLCLSRQSLEHLAKFNSDNENSS